MKYIEHFSFYASLALDMSSRRHNKLNITIVTISSSIQYFKSMIFWNKYKWKRIWTNRIVYKEFTKFRSNIWKFLYFMCMLSMRRHNNFFYIILTSSNHKLLTTQKIYGNKKMCGDSDMVLVESLFTNEWNFILKTIFFRFAFEAMLCFITFHYTNLPFACVRLFVYMEQYTEFSVRFGLKYFCLYTRAVDCFLDGIARK